MKRIESVNIHTLEKNFVATPVKILAFIEWINLAITNILANQSKKCLARFVV